MDEAKQKNFVVTQTFCAQMASVQFTDLLKQAIDEGKRGMLDWLGCALAGSRHSTLDSLLAVLQETGGRPEATVFGRGLRE
jgi:2-methylcitrate dehydratase PrpD